jgi:hypothetical protein
MATLPEWGSGLQQEIMPQSPGCMLIIGTLIGTLNIETFSQNLLGKIVMDYLFVFLAS